MIAYLSYALVAVGTLLTGAQLIALFSYLLHGPLALLKGLFAHLLSPILARIEEFDGALARGEHVLRSLVLDAAKQFVAGEDDDGQKWFWAGLVRPAMSFAAFAFLITVDVYVAALTFQALFGMSGADGTTGNWSLPTLSVNIPLLSGAMYGVLAVVFGEAFWDAASTRPRRPYAALREGARKGVAVTYGFGVLLVIASGPLFFLWRLGAVGTTNPYASLAPIILATLGVLLPLGTLAAARQGLPFLGALGVVTFLVAYIGLWLVRALSYSTHFGVELVLQAAKVLAESLLKIGERTRRLDGAIAATVVPAAASAIRGSQVAAASAIGIVEGATTGLSGAVIEATRGVFKIADDVIQGVGKGIGASGNAIVDAVRYTVLQTARAIGVVAVAFGSALASIGRSLRKAVVLGVPPAAAASATALRSLGRATRSAAIWIWKLVPRFRKMISTWICRFEFAKRLHFVETPPDDPSPVGRGRLEGPTESSSGSTLASLPPLTPVPTGSRAEQATEDEYEDAVPGPASSTQ
jgi:fumarate reductase subunit D